MKETAKAKETYAKARQLDPSWIASAHQTARHLLEDSMHKPAIAYLALRLAEQGSEASEFGDPEILLTLAKAQAATGDMGQACGTLQQCLAGLSQEQESVRESARSLLEQYQRANCPEGPEG
jgi:hypothetical protein